MNIITHPQLGHTPHSSSYPCTACILTGINMVITRATAKHKKWLIKEWPTVLTILSQGLRRRWELAIPVTTIGKYQHHSRGQCVKGCEDVLLPLVCYLCLYTCHKGPWHAARHTPHSLTRLPRCWVYAVAIESVLGRQQVTLSPDKEVCVIMVRR